MARAIAVGEDIVFGAGEYAPHRSAGRHLLAHVLAQVGRHRGDPHAVRLKKLEDAPAKEQQPISMPSSSVNISKERLADRTFKPPVPTEPIRVIGHLSSQSLPPAAPTSQAASGPGRLAARS